MRTAYAVAFVIIALFPLAATFGIARVRRDAGSVLSHRTPWSGG